MSYIPATSVHTVPTWSAAAPDLDAEPVSLGLLRHSTKNALQRIVAQLSTAMSRPELRASHALLQELERRVLLSAALSDALFGMTRSPGPLEQRLHAVCESTVHLIGDGAQVIGLDAAVEGACPPALIPTVLRAAHEMVVNAVKHGLHARLLGQVTVRLVSRASGTVLTVEDNGWGYVPAGCEGEGLGLLRALAELHGGTATLERLPIGSRATMRLPPRR
jgi:two-component sensor histidine kinase